MSLDILTDTWFDFLYLAGGDIGDGISTVIMTKKDGIKRERYPPLRRQMQSEGIVKAVSKHIGYNLVTKPLVVGTLYFFDYLLGIQENTINSHHLYCYIFGSMKYLGFLSNIARTYGFKKTADILGLPADIIMDTYETVESIKSSNPQN